MKVGVLGTGMVGNAIGTRLVELGHEVRMGSRQPGNEKAVGWAESAGERASSGDFADAATFGEIAFNCTAGEGSVDAVTSARDGLAGKLLIDVANTLDFSDGPPPVIAATDRDSLAEQIQRAVPEVRVVKTLNTVNNDVMVDPARVPGDHVVFVSGDDEDAKRQAVELLGEFGWPEDRVIDLGDISTARGPETYVGLWLRLMGALGTTQFNVGLFRNQA
ncbi:MAG TPA: NAD(P)-binding domain-containing protein [Solirubrobacterales bacterium]|jgi:predicted dinucleotide-binding enzyme